MSQLSNLVNTDSQFLSPPATRCWSYKFCGGRGHGQFKYPTMVVYGTTSFLRDIVEIRQQFQSDVCQMNAFSTSIRCDNDDRVIMKSFPKIKTPGLVIHRRLLIENSLVIPAVANAICVECTLLLPGDDEDVMYTLVLLKVNNVGSLCNKEQDEYYCYIAEP